LFIYTKHTLEKMDALGIGKDEVETAIKEGMKWKEKGTDKWHAQLAGTEAVFIKRQNDYFLIAVYLAGRSK